MDHLLWDIFSASSIKLVVIIFYSDYSILSALAARLADLVLEARADDLVGRGSIWAGLTRYGKNVLLVLAQEQLVIQHLLLLLHKLARVNQGDWGRRLQYWWRFLLLSQHSNILPGSLERGTCNLLMFVRLYIFWILTDHINKWNWRVEIDYALRATLAVVILIVEDLLLLLLVPFAE